MSALRRKLYRDAWRHRGPLSAIAVVMTCGVALFIALRSMHGYLRERQAAYYADSRFADLFVRVTRAPRGLAARVRAIPGVGAVEARVVSASRMDVPGLDEPATALLVSLPEPGQPGLNTVVLRAGQLPAAGRPDQVLASEAFARANGLGPGDSLAVILRGRWERVQIAGTAISPEFIYEIPPGAASVFPDNRHFGVIWMPAAGLAAAMDLTGAFNDLVLRFAPGAIPLDIVERVDALLAPYGGTGAYLRADQVSHQFVDSEIAETRVTSIFLPGVFLGVTAFLLNLVLSRLVATEREQIAVLKAFGFRDGVIARHYLAFAAIPVGVATIAGGALGLWLAGQFAAIYARFYQFPNAAWHADPAVLLLAVGVSGGAGRLGALGAVRRVVRLPPAEAMRPEGPASYRPGFLDRAGVVNRVPLAVRSIARSLQRMPLRALLTVTGLALAIGLTLAGLFMFDAIDYLKRLQFEVASRQDASVAFDIPLALGVRDELARLPGVRQVELRRDVPVRLRHGNRTVRTGLQGVEPGAELQRIVDDAEHVHRPRGGLLLTATLADRLGVRPGDLIEVDLLEGHRRSVTLPVSGTVRQMLGHGVYAELALVAELADEAPAATSALLRVDPRYRDALNQRLRALPAVAGVGWLDATLAGFEKTIAESFRISLVTLVLFAVIIAGGVVYNAGRITLAERGRELASLRVLGFTRGEVARMLLGEQGLLLACAIPLGLVVGTALAWLVVTRFSSDLFRLPLVVSAWSRVFAVGVVLIAGVVSGLLVWRRLARLDLVAVLKTRE